MHEALQRNGFMVPPYTSKCITTDYLSKVKTAEYYVPRYVDVQVRPCPNPPIKRRIFEEIMKEAHR